MTADDPSALGFGTTVAGYSTHRLLNKDGTFNVARRGGGWSHALNPYQTLLTVSWPSFLAFVFAFYVGANLFFAVAYLLAGEDSLSGAIVAPNSPGHGVFARAFFFSVHTFATIGYGNIVPASLASNLLVTVESLIGLLSVALVTGLLFARFSRPSARIRYSRSAVISPYRGITAFEFRCVNQRRAQLIDVHAHVMFSRLVQRGGTRAREFTTLPLEYDSITFFALSWTVVHPINERSPLFGLTDADLDGMEAEFFVLMSGTDETFSQVVHSRSSYKPGEIVWNSRFASMFVESGGAGVEGMDMSRIDEVERVEPVAVGMRGTE